jgi:hypothetical protein
VDNVGPREKFHGVETKPRYARDRSDVKFGLGKVIPVRYTQMSAFSFPQTKFSSPLSVVVLTTSLDSLQLYVAPNALPVTVRTIILTV